jgi:putative transposase
VTPVAKRNAVVHLCETHGVSQRRACDVLQIDRSTVRYLSRRGDDTDLRDAIKRVSRERRRFGCRRIHGMIAREGFEVNYYPSVHVYMHERAQEVKTYLPGREAAGTPQRWQETCFGHAKANGAA